MSIVANQWGIPEYRIGKCLATYKEDQYWGQSPDMIHMFVFAKDQAKKIDFFVKMHQAGLNPSDYLKKPSQ